MEKIYFTALSGFQAARSIDAFDANNPLSRLHGHGFEASLRLQGQVKRAAFPGDEVDVLLEDLREITSKFDYQHLNKFLAVPSDANLASYIRDLLPHYHPELVSVRSTKNQGVCIDGEGQTVVWRRFGFQAAHYLPNVREGHKCGRMHGHNFEVVFHVQLDVGGDQAYFQTHEEIARKWQTVFRRLDRTCLNQIEGLENPTSEMVSRWLWNQLSAKLPRLSSVTVYETSTCGAIFNGKDFHIWKDFSFDSATRLEAAPENDLRSGLYGHSYLLRLHLCAPLDEIKGWTVDFGDIKEIFSPIYKEIDHRRIDQLPGIDDGSVAALARWIRVQIRETLPIVDRVDLYSVKGCGVIVTDSKGLSFNAM